MNASQLSSEGGDREVRAVLCKALDGPDALQLGSLTSRKPGPGEVRLRILACGLNYPDLLTTRGAYQFKPELPFSPGMEVAGTVIDCGTSIAGFKPGDQVIARTMTQYPGLAEEVTLPAGLLLPKPADMDFAAAASFVIAYYTAYNALVEKARLAAGETLLVHGAAGGVGLAAVQIGKALGAIVIATSNSPQKRDRLRLEGADHTLDAAGDIRQALKDLTQGRGVDVVLDPVGGGAFDSSLRATAPGGRILLIGFTSGTIPQIPANIVLIKEVSVIGVRAGEFSRRHPDAFRASYDQLVRWFEEGRLKPRIWRTYPLERAADAMRALEDRRVIGKVAVVMDRHSSLALSATEEDGLRVRKR